MFDQYNKTLIEHKKVIFLSFSVLYLKWKIQTKRQTLYINNVFLITSMRIELDYLFTVLKQQQQQLIFKSFSHNSIILLSRLIKYSNLVYNIDLIIYILIYIIYIYTLICTCFIACNRDI